LTGSVSPARPVAGCDSNFKESCRGGVLVKVGDDEEPLQATRAANAEAASSWFDSVHGGSPIRKL